MSDDRQTQERRAETRHEVTWHGRLDMPDGQAPCKVRDICCNGVRISTATPLETGAEISVHIEHLGGFSGTVVWHRGDCYGVKFASPSTVIWHFLGCWTSPDRAARSRQV